MQNAQRLVALFVALIGLGAVGTARATDYYVATTGSDSNAGTMDAPWATLQKGASTAVAGDTVWIRGGTYAVTTPANSGAGINFSKSGTSSANINYFAYQGEVPVFDFTNLQISTTGYTMGFVVSGSYLHFKGLEICCVPMNMYSNNGISVNTPAANDTFELLNMHHNSGNGIFVGNKSGGGHLILNCDAHDNYDATSNQGQGQNADGFGVHYQTTGGTTIIRGCRSWWNSDDGYDLINQEVPVTVENSWAMMNGYAMYGTFNPADGNGNGFKMGSSKTGIRHLVQNNVAWKNKANGFYANHSTGGNTWYNNTSFMNGSQYNMLASSFDASGNVVMTVTLSGALAHIMRNNIGYPNNNQNMTGVDTMFNSWDLGITPASSDFASTSDPSVSMTGMQIEGMGALGPRQADGSLPNVDFLHLSAGSRMIDKGTDVGLPYLGTAPDLGAYEYGATSTGGASGTGGTPGPGGSSGASGTGGAPTGGTGGAGGATAASGGGSGTSATGGAPGAGGTVSATGGAGGTSGETASGGCSCALDDASGRAPVALVLLAVGGLSRSRRRAGRRR
ncbi:MAG TPA: right-handed parallel beta-helix repeat-containing protein [Polyangia bacterium]|nr:right-handed parallel beta-helix repeat-containing protein [Polyangia bacterium]